MTVSSITATRSATLFDLNTGLITPRFKHQMNLVGLIARQFFTEYPAEHVINVNELLQTNGCFQRDCFFYKSGRTSSFVITYEQAAAFLDDDYEERKIYMVRRRGPDITSASIWKEDIKRYGYREAFNSEEKATIAWASSAWNGKAHQVNAEMRTYKTTHVSQ